MASKHKLHKENCQTKVRKSYTSKSGIMISLIGRHGFEWSVTRESKHQPVVSITTYPDRVIATREYENLKKSIS